MNFFRRLFGAREVPKAIPSASAKTPAAAAGDPIQIYDKYGREFSVERDDWRKVLEDNLKASWTQPDALAAHVTQALQDGFFVEIEEAAQQLQRIDTNPERGASLLGIVYLQTDRPEACEATLKKHINDHGESGVVLTNLAKAESALGREDDSLETLWRALQLDPNQDNALLWYEAIFREKEGTLAGVAAMRRVAELPESWRAPLWVARHELEARELDAALDLYRESLERAPRPVPADLLMQLSGDLGNQGHLIQLLELVQPHFDLELHGLQVGNNLLKASIDTGQLDAARELLDQLQAQQRPDWRETLGFWESAWQKARIGSADPIRAEDIQVSTINLNGPLWIPDDHPIAKHYPPAKEGSPVIIVSGSTYERPVNPTEVEVTGSDTPGRLSRAIPMLLSEHLSLRTPAKAITLIPWILNQSGGFVVSSAASSEAQIAEVASRYAEESGESADYAFNVHLLVQGENYTLVLRLVRVIEGRGVAEIRKAFPEGGFHRIADEVFHEVGEALVREAGLSLAPPVEALEGDELEHYLLRLEQSLAMACSTMDTAGPSFLSNPSEILDGLIHLSLQNPGHVPSRVLLLRALRRWQPVQPELVESMRTKVEALMAEHPIEAVQDLLVKELDEVYGDTD